MQPERNEVDRLPPQSREAERSVLGSMLRLNDVIGEVIQILRAENFYTDAHQKVYEAIVTLYDKGNPVDLITLAEELRQRGHIEDIGGYGYLGELYEAAPTAANAEYHARIVRERAMVRSLIQASTTILRDAYDQVAPADEMLGNAERQILDIAERGTVGQTYTLSEAMKEAYARIDERSQSGHLSFSGLSTGFTDLDEITAGLQKSELIIVAARPSVGKTAFALNLVRNMTVNGGHSVFFVSLEQSHIELAERFALRLQAHVNSHRLRKGTLSSEDMEKLIEAGGVLKNARLFIDDTPGQGMLRIAANARRLARRNRRSKQSELSAVVIDYLQLIEPDNRRDPRQEQVAPQISPPPQVPGSRIGDPCCRSCPGQPGQRGSSGPPAAPGRPARERFDRAGCRHRYAAASARPLRAGAEGERRYHRSDYRQAAQWSDRRGAADIRQGIYAVRELCGGDAVRGIDRSAARKMDKVRQKHTNISVDLCAFYRHLTGNKRDSDVRKCLFLRTI